MISPELRRRLDDIITRYAALDDAEYILTHSIAEFRTLAVKYGDDLGRFLLAVIDPVIIQRATQRAAESYAKALAKQIASGKIKKQMIDRRRLVESILDSWREQAESIARNNVANLTSKATQFQALAAAAEIPIERAREIAQLEITATRIGGRLYKYRELNALWQRMNQSYGTRDTIQFRNGVNYPLRAYVDARALTTEAEAHRMATLVEASADGVWFGTTDRTGTTDSCIFHEGAVFFLSEEARAQARAKYGSAVSGMRTWQEIVADKTHMGKFGCRHIVRPLPWQFLSDDKARARLEAAKKAQPEVPKKIDERKIFEQITGRKWESSTIKTAPSYSKIIPPRGKDPERYTIA